MGKLEMGLVAFAGGAAVIACAAQPPGTSAVARSPSGGQCFLVSDVNSYHPTSDGNVDIQAGANRYFRLTLGGGCPNVDWTTRVGIRPVGGGNFVCEGYEAELIAPDPAQPGRCPVSAVHAISKEQFMAGQHR